MTRPSVTPAAGQAPTTAWPADSTSSPPSTGVLTSAGSPSPASSPTPNGSPSWRLTVELGRIFGANQAPRHKLAAWRIAAAWRDGAYLLAHNAKLPKLGHATVALTVHLRAGRKADQQNYLSGPSLKGLLDGLVRYGLVTDDREPFLTVSCRTAALEGGRPRVVVDITPKEAP